MKLEFDDVGYKRKRNIWTVMISWKQALPFWSVLPLVCKRCKISYSDIMKICLYFKQFNKVGFGELRNLWYDNYTYFRWILQSNPIKIKTNFQTLESLAFYQGCIYVFLEFNIFPMKNCLPISFYNNSKCPGW